MTKRYKNNTIHSGSSAVVHHFHVPANCHLSPRDNTRRDRFDSLSDNSVTLRSGGVPSGKRKDRFFFFLAKIAAGRNDFFRKIVGQDQTQIVTSRKDISREFSRDTTLFLSLFLPFFFHLLRPFFSLSRQRMGLKKDLGTSRANVSLTRIPFSSTESAFSPSPLSGSFLSRVSRVSGSPRIFPGIRVIKPSFNGNASGTRRAFILPDMSSKESSALARDRKKNGTS